MPFSAGEEVVCINADPYAFAPPSLRGVPAIVGVVLWARYVVIWAGPVSHPLHGDYDGVLVDGVNSAEKDGTVVPLNAKRFAPLRKNQYDISVLEKCLLPESIEAARRKLYEDEIS